MNVLIVDDQASQRAILRHLVQDIGEDIRVTVLAAFEATWDTAAPL